MHNKIFGWLLPVIIVLMTVLVWAVASASAALWVLLPCFIIYALFHLVHLQRLQRWADNSPKGKIPPLEGVGVWKGVLSNLYIREQKLYKRDARQRQAIKQFRRLTEEIPDGVVVLDKNNCIDWCNTKAQEWLELEGNKDRGVPVHNLVRAPDFLTWLNEDPADDAGRFSRTLVLRIPENSGRACMFFRLPFGKKGHILLIRDVSDYEKAAQLRRDFIASVSHELKTPLTVIVGFLETIQDMGDDDVGNKDTRQRYITLMQQQASGMQRLVEDLLILSALESGQHREEEQWFSSALFLRQVHENVEVLSQGKHNIVLKESCGAELFGMVNDLSSALTNLLSNAVRYTPEGGYIEILFSVDEKNRALMTVRDTGIGIAEAHLPRLTERFYRVDRSRSRASGGTGLGLAIVKHVLIQHQADLLIQSTPGEGSSFTIILPATRVQKVIQRNTA